MNFDSSVLQVAIEDVIPNRFQPRLSFDDGSLTELAASIKEHGIIQPLVLRRIGDKYEIIAGERRYKAAMMAGLSSVPAVISNVDDKTSAEVAVLENVQRRDLTAIEEAKSYKALLDQGFMTVEQLAKKIGISLYSIQSKLKLLNLCDEVQKAILENKISERHARALLVVDNKEDQVKWLNKIINERLTVRALDNELKKVYGGNIMNQNIDINTVKQNATDIAIPQSNMFNVQNQTGPSDPLAMGPIDLGQKTTNKFFNSLEDEAVNMQMTEAINPFKNINSENVSPEVANQNQMQTPINNFAPQIDQQVISQPIQMDTPQQINQIPNTMPDSNNQFDSLFGAQTVEPAPAAPTPQVEEDPSSEFEAIYANPFAGLFDENSTPIDNNDNYVANNQTAPAFSTPITDSFLNNAAEPSVNLQMPEQPVQINVPQQVNQTPDVGPSFENTPVAGTVNQNQTFDNLFNQPVAESPAVSEPIPATPVTNNIDNAKLKIQNLINELKAENYNINFGEMETNTGITYTIMINK